MDGLVVEAGHENVSQPLSRLPFSQHTHRLNSRGLGHLGSLWQRTQPRPGGGIEKLVWWHPPLQRTSLMQRSTEQPAMASERKTSEYYNLDSEDFANAVIQPPQFLQDPRGADQGGDSAIRGHDLDRGRKAQAGGQAGSDQAARC